LIAIANGGTSRKRQRRRRQSQLRQGGSRLAGSCDARSDFSLKYRDFGIVRARDSSVYDKAASRQGRARYQGDRPHGALLRACSICTGSGKLDFAGRALFVRVGEQVVNWGESTFIRNGINVLNPVDRGETAHGQPGAELKDALSPTPDGVVAAGGHRSACPIEATWMPRWDEHFPDTHVRPEPRGKFFSTNDFAVDDGKI
jgi:hypothetical protein